MLGQAVKKAFKSVCLISILSGCVAPSKNQISSLSDTTGDTCPWQKPQDLLLSSFESTFGDYRELSLSEMRADLDCLRKTISKHYIAAHHYAARGYSLDAALSKVSQNITSSLKQDQLMDIVLDAHKPAYDAHVTYIFRAASNEPSFYKHLDDYLIYSLPQEFMRASNPDEFVSRDGSVVIRTCERFQVHPSGFDQGKQQFVFIGQFRRDEGTGARPVACVDSHGQRMILEAHEVALNKLDARANEFYFEMAADKSYMLVRIPKMTSGVSPEQQSLLELIEQTPMDREFPIIFDLRQNGGGDDSFAYELGVYLRPTSQQNPSLDMVDKVSLYATASSTNKVFLEWQKLLRQGNPNAPRYEEKYRKYLQQFQEQVASGLTLDTEATIVEHSSPNGNGRRQQDWSKPILLLVDKGCASSCESMIEIFSTIKNAKIIGTHSGGYLSFGNIGVMMLPYSKIGFQGGWRYFKTSGQEGLGYAPGVYDVGADILAIARGYLERN